MFRCEKGDCRFRDCELWRLPNEQTFGELARSDEDGNLMPFDFADPNWKQPFLEIEGETEIEGSPAKRPRRWSEDAVQCLTDRQRQAVALFREEKTQVEAAAIMGISQPRYYQILYGEHEQGGAIRKLRKYLSQRD